MNYKNEKKNDGESTTKRGRSLSPSAERSKSLSPLGKLSVAEIVRLIDEREQARKVKNWVKADNIRDNLRAKGINIYDKQRTWTMGDGKQYIIGQEIKDQSKTIPHVTTELVWIEQMIQEREQARHRKDWVKADEIRESLKSKGIFLFDKDKYWKSEDGQIGIIPSWYNDTRILTLKCISTLLKEREEARKIKNWSKADKIRELLREHGIDLYDKHDTWSASDGRSGNITYTVKNHRNVQPGQMMNLGMGGAGMVPDMGIFPSMGMGMGPNNLPGNLPGNLPRNLPCNLPGMIPGMIPGMMPGNMPSSLNMIGGRSTALLPDPPSAMNFSKSIAPMNSMRMNTHEDEILNFIFQREHARSIKDFRLADQIRQLLKANQIELYDKEKTWRAADGRQGKIPSFDEVATKMMHNIDMGSTGRMHPAATSYPPNYVTGNIASFPPHMYGNGMRHNYPNIL